MPDLPDLPKNWAEYFRSLPGFDQGNRDSTPHSQIWSPDAHHKNKMRYLLTGENNAIILAADANHDIIALHSFNDIYDGLDQAEDWIVCLVGGGRDVPVIHVIEKSLTTSCSGVTPGVEELMSCTTAYQVRGLPAPDADTVADNYHGSATFCADPWLAYAVMKARTCHPHELIPIAIDAALAFDKKHRRDSTCASKAADCIGNFVQWAWLVGARKISNVETRFSIYAQRRGKTYGNEMESLHLQKETTIWGQADDETLEWLFINAIVDPSNLSGVYIVWVLRQHFPRHFESCHTQRKRESVLNQYRKKACDFLTRVSIEKLSGRILREQLMKAKSDAEDGLEIGCLMTGLLIRDNDDKDVMEIIAGIDMTENQKERMKQLFHQKTIAELFELYPRWCINKMDKPDEASWAHPTNLPCELNENDELTQDFNIEEAFGSDSNSMSSLRLRDFEIVSFLGEGEFGQVVAARLHPSKYPVALKVFSKEMLISQYEKEVSESKNPDMRTSIKDQLKREIDIQSGLSHENIVKCFGHFYNVTNIFLILEYCPGVNLRLLCFGNGLPEKEVAKYVSDVSRALLYCHERNVMHRDIKTENLLLDAKGNVKLADFGFAVKLGDYLQYTLCGTNEYMAPEIIDHSGYAEDAELWAMGILVFELLTGSEPFAGEDRAEIRKKMEEDITWPVGIDDRARDLVTRLLQMNPVERLSFDGVLNHTFLSIVDGESH